jgi:nicotinamide-nucleotide adenylyltransferase
VVKFPGMQKKYKIALLIGRFQPFHKGHLFLIKETLKKAEKIIIGIGSVNVTDKNNPWSYEERKKILEKVIQEEKIIDKVVSVIGVNDFNDDKKWFKEVMTKAGNFDVVVGNNEWTNGILEKAGYPILRLGFFNRYLHEGEKIRKLMKEGGEWRGRVPVYLDNMLKSKVQISNDK